MATTYLMSYHNAEEQVIETSIEDSAGSLGTIELIAGEEGSVTIGAVDNDELKYGIKSSRATIKFINSDTINLDTFSTGEDGKWKVTITVNTKTIFLGWLEQGGISQPFLPLGTQIVTLTALDGLAYLNDAPYVDFDGVTIVNKFRTDITIAKHVARCLARTGLALNINVIDNRREVNNPGVTWFDTCSVFPEAWEDTINTAISSRDVLERILGVDNYIHQSKGAWWIIRTTEVRQDFNTYLTVFDSTGTLTAGFTAITLEKTIGSPTTNPAFSAYFSEAATLESRNRPYKSSELDFPYQFPAEILCNSNFVRGDFIADLADEVDDDGNTLTVKSFNTDCWDYQKLTATIPPVLTTQDSNAYTKVRYRDGHELERYVHFEATAAHPAIYQLVNQMKIPMGVSDRFTVSFSFKWSADLGGAKPYFVTMGQFRLYADDGSFWGCNASDGNVGNFWGETDSDFLFLVPVGVNDRPRLLYSVNDNTDLTKWISATFEIPSAPRSGNIEFVLQWFNEDTTAFTRDTSPVNITYHPYVGGAYDVFTGQSYTETQSGDYKRNLTQQVYISNAPRPLIKGAIKVISGGNYIPAGKFYEGQQFPADDPTDADKFEFGELQIRAFHNQNRNIDQKYLATCQGREFGQEDSDGNADVIDLIHKVYNRDIDPVANNTALQLVNQEVNWRTCSWTATLIQNFDVNIGFADDPVVFQYIGGAFAGGGGGGGGGGVAASTASSRFGVSGEDDTAGQNRSFDMTTGDWTFSYLGNSGNTSPLIQVSGGTKGISSSGSITAGEFSSPGLPLWSINQSPGNGGLSGLVFSRVDTTTPANGDGIFIDADIITTDTSTVAPQKIIFELDDANTATYQTAIRFTGVTGGVGAEQNLLKLHGDGSWDIIPMTATAASAITPTEGKMLFVSTTNGTFTSIGLWCYENGAWSKK